MFASNLVDERHGGRVTIDRDCWREAQPPVIPRNIEPEWPFSPDEGALYRPARHGWQTASLPDGAQKKRRYFEIVLDLGQAHYFSRACVECRRTDC